MGHITRPQVKPGKSVDTIGLNAKTSYPGDGKIGQPRDVTSTLGPAIVTDLAKAKNSDFKIIDKEKLDSVNKSVYGKVLKFAQKFGDIRITSGKRTIEEQAKIMAKMSDKDLDMYLPGTYVAVIKEEAKLNSKKRDYNEVLKIIKKAHDNGKGSFISRHIAGHAVDISTRYGSFNLGKAKSIASKCGLTWKEEESRHCFHMQFIPKK